MHSDRSRPFEFNPKLDVAFLNELFEGDTEYATTIFGDFINDLPAYWSEVEEAYSSKNIKALKAAVHKTKTLFGYVGHTHVLEIFQAFEHKCGDITDISELKDDYKLMRENKDIAQLIIKEEYQRLKLYLQNV